jgi:hypothetical protein
MWSKFGILNHN